MSTLLIKNNQSEMYEENAYFLKVISHPVRLEIINQLNENTLNVNQLSEILGIPQSTTSQHLSKMKGLILRSKRNGLEIYYQISNEKVVQILKILQDI
ncbi:metalloregulator ArsR/SmtB family transcription factor [Bacillus paramobilis]|uniref:ArsR/SmtB family transcription factor n=1 Tax=Bacillus paramobilis TaxID=2817477 RepID=UPI003D1D4FD6